MPLSVAFVASGKLFLKEGDRPGREVVSAFGQQVIARALKAGERDGWKFRRRSGGFLGGALWGGRDPEEMALVPPRITGVARVPDKDTMLYLLETEAVGGLFRFDRSGNQEHRLFHKEGFRARDPDFHPDLRLLAFSLPLPNGVASIMTADPDGRDIDRHTEGDSVDEAPSWLPDHRRALVYHSSGIARSARGEPVGLAPSSLHKLDLETKKAEVLASNGSFDYLQPHGTPTGDLLFIRRPYESPYGRSPSVLTVLKDIVFFPFRVGRSILSFLDAFSIAFSQKPLMTAGGPKMKGPEIHNLYVRGRALDARKAMREAGQAEEPPALVPASWELVRRKPDGTESVLAKHVLAYDVGPKGTVVTTNGSAVYALDGGGGRRRLEKNGLIDQVVLLEESS
jgi:hypothetical protein